MEKEKEKKKEEICHMCESKVIGPFDAASQKVDMVYMMGKEDV